jgi:tetratricopeptide (TPR) repeat protein
MTYKILLFTFLSFIAQLARGQELGQAFSQSHAAEQKGDLKLAIAALQGTKDNGYLVLLRLGYLHFSSGLSAEAMQYYQQAIKQRPFAIEPRLGMANAAAQANNWSQVQSQYEAILRIDPNQTYVHYQLGMIKYNKKDYAHALRHFEKVANLYPADFDGMIMLAWTHFRLGKLKEAKVLFQQVLWLRPNNPSALEGLSMIK